MYIVYKYIFPDGKVYIGRTKSDIESRSCHGIRYGALVGKAIKDFGWDNISKEILFEVDTVEEADKLERECIIKYNSTNIEFGYNMTKGGTGGWSVSSHRKPLSEETRRKIGDNTRKCLTGRKVPPEVIKKRSDKLKGHIVTEETRDKISIANTGRHPNELTRKKMSENNCMHNLEIREKMKQSLKKTQEDRVKKRLQTIKSRYPNGFRQSEESNKKRSQSMIGIPKSEETRQKMRKPKSPKAIENMRKAQVISHKARKLGITYKEYIELYGVQS